MILCYAPVTPHAFMGALSPDVLVSVTPLENLCGRSLTRCKKSLKCKLDKKTTNSREGKP